MAEPAAARINGAGAADDGALELGSVDAGLGDETIDLTGNVAQGGHAACRLGAGGRLGDDMGVQIGKGDPAFFTAQIDADDIGGRGNDLIGDAGAADIAVGAADLADPAVTIISTTMRRLNSLGSPVAETFARKASMTISV